MKVSRVPATVIDYRLQPDMLGTWNAYNKGKIVATGRTLNTCRENAFAWLDRRRSTPTRKISKIPR